MGVNVAMLGANGLIGKNLVDLFLNDDAVSELHVYVRTKIENKHPKLIQHLFDFEKATTVDLNGCTALFCCIGTTIKKAGSKTAFKKVDLEIPLFFAREGKRQNVGSYYLVSSVGASAETSNFYLHVKGELENALSALQFHRLVIFRPSMLLGKRAEFRMGELIGKVLMQLLGILFVGPFKKYKAIPARKVAIAMQRSFHQDGISSFEIVESDVIVRLAV